MTYRSSSYNLIWYGLASYVPGAMSVVGVSLYIRLLSPTEYGYFSLWLTTVLLVSTAFSTWLRQGILRFCSEYREVEAGARFYTTVFFLTFITCISIVCLAILAYPVARLFISGPILWLYALGVLGVALSIVVNVYLSVWQAEKQPKIYACFRMLTSFLTVLVSLGFLFLREDKEATALCLGFVSGYGVGGMLGGAQLWFRHRRKGKARPYVERRIAGRLFEYGMPFVGWFIGTYSLGFADRYMLSLFSTIAAVGAYSALYALISGISSFLITPIIMTAHPEIVDAWLGDSSRTDAQRVLQTYTRLFLMVALPFISLLFASGQIVGEFLLPPEYAPDRWTVLFLTIAIFMNGFSLLGQKGLELAERTWHLLILMAGSVFANILLNVFLIPRMAGRGAAVSALLSYGMYMVLAVQKSKSYLPLTIHVKSLARIVLAACGVFLVASLLGKLMDGLPAGTRLAAIGSGSTLVYLGLLTASQEVSLSLVQQRVATLFFSLRKNG